MNFLPKIKSLFSLAEQNTNAPSMTVRANGSQEWRVNGKLHRVDGPAYISGDYQIWYLNGELHRTDGPAVTVSNRHLWWLNGGLHRTDGPAIIDGDCQEWYLHGEKYTFNDWLKNVNATPEEKTMLRLKWAK